MTPLLTDDEMPALPHPTIGMADPTNQGRWVHYYTAEQMRARDRAVEARVREKMGAQPTSAEQQPVAWFSPEQKRAMAIIQSAAKALEEGTFTAPTALAERRAAAATRDGGRG